MPSQISDEYLKQMLFYDPLTGAFTWITPQVGRRMGDIAGSIAKDGYRIIRIGGKGYPAHVLAWLYVYGEYPPSQIDHRDLDKGNNAISNLRLATNSQNNANKPGIFCRKFKGTGLSKSGRFISRIKVGGSEIWLGTFDTEQEAAHFYNKAAIEHFGEFATLNPIGEDYEQ